jgi:hypothetical protein
VLVSLSSAAPSVAAQLGAPSVHSDRTQRSGALSLSPRCLGVRGKFKRRSSVESGADSRSRCASRFPVEIWQQILPLACVDGGLTGSSLAYVSHHMRNLSVRVKLQSVSVTGLWQLRSLLHLLENTAEEDRHVRFLFVATHAYDPRNAIEAERFRGRKITPQQQYDQEAWLSQRWQDGSHEWHTTCEAVLTLVAPHVEVVTLNVPYVAQDAILPWGIPFPALQDLAVGQIRLATLDIDSLPPVRRLRLFGDILPSILNRLAAVRGLEYIRLSGGGNEWVLANVIGDLLGKTNIDERLDGIFPDLRALIIEPGEPSMRDVQYRSSIRDWYNAVGQLQRLAIHHPCGQGRPGVEILDPRPVTEGYTIELARYDWRAVVEMRSDGTWSVVDLGRSAQKRDIGLD